MRYWAGIVVVAACKFEPGVLPATDDAPVDMPRDDARPIDTRPIDAMLDARECPASPTANCVGFTCPGSTSCYYLCGTGTTGKQSYAGAKSSCGNVHNSCVVTINDAAEDACIIARAVPDFPDSMVWLGFAQASNGAEPDGGWSWECGDSTYLAGNWGMFEPNNDGQFGEDCSAYGDGGAWLDVGCNGSARFVCELP